MAAASLATSVDALGRSPDRPPVAFRLPAVLAMDGVQHSWASYSETFNQVLIAGAGPQWVDAVAVPVHLVAGARDGVTDLAYLQKLAATRGYVSLAVWPGDSHDLPLTHPEHCRETILSVLPAVTTGDARAISDTS